MADNLVDFDDFTYQPNPPSAERVARRALVLAAVGNRGLLENELHDLSALEESRGVLMEWLRDCGAEDELEPEERAALEQPAGQLDDQVMIDATWRLEGLGVLLWALDKYELPPYDELVLPKDLFEIVGIYCPEVGRSLIESAALRPIEELEAYWKHATMAHWRFREFSLRPVAMDFVTFSQGCWIGTFDLSNFRIKKKDLEVGGRPIAKAEGTLVSMCQSIANERHLAANWVLGDCEIYSETDTST